MRLVNECLRYDSGRTDARTDMTQINRPVLDGVRKETNKYLVHFHISDIDECDVDAPCQHSGTCTNSPGSYTCDCTNTGYEGTNCETGE